MYGLREFTACMSNYSAVYFFFFTVPPRILILSRFLFIQLNAQLDCFRKMLKSTLKCSYMFQFNNHHQGAYCCVLLKL